MLEFLRFALCAALTLCGLVALISGVVGGFRFHYALSRLHAAALLDTVGIMLRLAGVMVAWLQVGAMLIVQAVFDSFKSLPPLFYVLQFGCASGVLFGNIASSPFYYAAALWLLSACLQRVFCRQFGRYRHCRGVVGQVPSHGERHVLRESADGGVLCR